MFLLICAGIREHLLENDFTCPMCNETDVSPDTLAPNKALRTVSPLYGLVSCPDPTPHEEEKGSGYKTTSCPTLEGRNQMPLTL